MADFKPVSPPFQIADAGGTAYTVVGWYSADLWDHIHPVVKNPDGPGVAPWILLFGEDPWHIVG